MIIRYLVPLLGVLGLVFAVMFTQNFGKAKAPEPNQLSVPPSTPYQNTVSGTGIVESNTRNIEIGSYLSGIVSEVYVKEGDNVKAGDPLFKLDDREASAAFSMAEKEVKAAEARLQVAMATQADENDKWKRISRMNVGTVISEDRRERQRFATKRASASTTSASAEVEALKASRDQVQVQLERLTVKAPADAQVLKVNINPGEFVMAGDQGTQPILLGAIHPLHLRVSIDENDVWRFTGNANAKASLRSNKEISFPLTFVRIEPYVQPKRNLSGDTVERVDTRVLEVIYSFEPNPEDNIFIGQQMDVFVEAGANPVASETTTQDIAN